MTIKQQSVAASAAHVLAAPSMGWALGDVTPENIEAKLMEAHSKLRNLSDGEVCLFRIARAICRERGGPDLAEIMRTLDDDSLKRVIEAICALRPGAAL